MSFTVKEFEWRLHDRNMSKFDTVPACNGRTDRRTSRT